MLGSSSLSSFSLYVFFCELVIVISTAWSKPCIPQLTRKKTSATMHEASPKVAPTAKVCNKSTHSFMQKGSHELDQQHLC